MKIRLVIILSSIIWIVSCTTQATVPTGDMQFFELKGNVSSLSGWNLYYLPDSTASFDNLGFIKLPGDVTFEEEVSPQLAEYSGPFKVVRWNPDPEEGDDYDFMEPMGTTLVYDSTNRLVMVSEGFVEQYLYYDKKGRLCSVLIVCPDGSSVSEITYDKDGNRVEEHYVDLDMDSDSDVYDRTKPAEMEGNSRCVEYDKYVFDKNGNWISRRILYREYDEEITGEAEESRVISYD